MNMSGIVATSHGKNPITRMEIAVFSESVPIGKRLRRMTFRNTEGIASSPVGSIEEETACTMKRKFPYIAETSKGYFPWSLLTLWNRELADGYLDETRERRERQRQGRGGIRFAPVPDGKDVW